jgi:betaine-aldehyde dehydrogenase
MLENFIGGKRVATSGEGTHAVHNAATGEVIDTMGVSGAEDVEAAVEAARAGFAEWGQATPSERSLAMLRIADAIESRADELARLETDNTGKPLALVLSEEVPPAVDQLRFFAGAARNLGGLASAEYMAGHTSQIRREPIGVTAGITPWNYP